VIGDPHAQILQILVQLLMDVFERRWPRYAVRHGEGQAMRLSGAVVGVLAEDHHFRVGMRRQMERPEDLILGRVHLVAATFFRDERLESLPVKAIRGLPERDRSRVMRFLLREWLDLRTVAQPPGVLHRALALAEADLPTAEFTPTTPSMTIVSSGPEHQTLRSASRMSSTRG
jgi:hypothetical protein